MTTPPMSETPFMTRKVATARLESLFNIDQGTWGARWQRGAELQEDFLPLHSRL